MYAEDGKAVQGDHKLEQKTKGHKDAARKQHPNKNMNHTEAAAGCKSPLQLKRILAAAQSHIRQKQCGRNLDVQHHLASEPPGIRSHYWREVSPKDRIPKVYHNISENLGKYRDTHPKPVDGSKDRYAVACTRGKLRKH